MLASFPGSHVWDMGTSLVPQARVQGYWELALYPSTRAGPSVIIVFGVSFLC